MSLIQLMFRGVGVLCVLAGALPQARAQEAATVTALGQAAIYGGDVAAARDKAIDDALRKAVEQAVGTMVSSETVTENFQLISDKILSQSKGYVQSYRVVSEKKEGDALYQVNVEAKVSSGNLKNDLDGIMRVLQAKNLPRVLIMVAEQNINQSGLAFWWGENGQGSVSSTDLTVVENTFIDHWTKKGLQFVDRQALQGKLSTTGAVATSATPSTDFVKEFAGNSGADVVIIGKAVANDNGSIMGTKLHSVRANVSLRALNLDTGAILATANTTKAQGHVDATTAGAKALEDASREAADKLLADILERWSKEVSGPATVSLKVSNVQKSGFLRQLETVLRNEVRGVQAVRQRSYRSKVAELEVDIKGSAQDLATELEEKKFKGFAVEINEITANSIAAAIR